MGSPPAIGVHPSIGSLGKTEKRKKSKPDTCSLVFARRKHGTRWAREDDDAPAL